MVRNGSSKWNRDADLEAIKVTYGRYADAGRAQLWDRHNPGYERLATDLRRRIVSCLRASVGEGGRRVLDLGCGSGDLALEAEAIGLVTDWVGVDLLPEPIAAARRAYPRGRFLVASADDVPGLDSSFDVVVAQVLFSSLPSEPLEAAVAREIGRLLRPGGWLVWSDLRYSNPTNPAVHGLGRGRVRRLFPGWEGRLESAGLLPPLARRLGPATGFLYPMFSAVPAMRSHLVGRLQRPLTGEPA